MLLRIPPYPYHAAQNLQGDRGIVLSRFHLYGTNVMGIGKLRLFNEEVYLHTCYSERFSGFTKFTFGGLFFISLLSSAVIVFAYAKLRYFLLDIVISSDKQFNFSDLQLLPLSKSRISHKYSQQATLLSNFNCDCELKSQK